MIDSILIFVTVAKSSINRSEFLDIAKVILEGLTSLLVVLNSILKATEVEQDEAILIIGNAKLRILAVVSQLLLDLDLPLAEW